MAIVFHSDVYSKIKIDSHIINGVIGYNYEEFLECIIGDNTYYIDNNTINSHKKVSSVISNSEKIDKYLKDLGLEKSFLNKNINDLSHSEQKLLKYLKMLVVNPNVIIINEPFFDLDYDTKKKIALLLKDLVKKKTIILGSFDTNIIYTQCKKVLLLGKEKYLYDDVTVLSNKRILRQYHIDIPEIIEFIRLAKEKRRKLPYSKDIRDLIKDVYRSVSK